jgi:hypothetical protein
VIIEKIPLLGFLKLSMPLLMLSSDPKIILKNNLVTMNIYALSQVNVGLPFGDNVHEFCK